MNNWNDICKTYAKDSAEVETTVLDRPGDKITVHCEHLTIESLGRHQKKIKNHNQDFRL